MCAKNRVATVTYNGGAPDIGEKTKKKERYFNGSNAILCVLFLYTTVSWVLEELLGKMIDISPASYITALIMLTSLVFLGLALNLRTRLYEVFIRFLPLGRIESSIAKFNEIAVVILSSITTYNAGWPSFFLVVPTIMKWSCYCLGLSQFSGKQIQVQQGLYDKRNVVDLCHAIDHIKLNGQVQRQVTITSVDNEPTFQQNSHSRQELVEILVSSNKYDRRDVEDVMNRYLEQNGELPTMEEFVEFHGGLKGIVKA
ncbi:hypothetical protein KUTeg_003220 [Tegillarca granosa]|uniref:Uncharacterized protein n=1 Tax=Tegillarca granosa TaxID=220873 RepID=A0ABQ9FLH5_TEGGR|nr:hypothetical protein KUTeg_003220 [Tegillarca granosa]